MRWRSRRRGEVYSSYDEVDAIRVKEGGRLHQLFCTHVDTLIQRPSLQLLSALLLKRRATLELQFTSTVSSSGTGSRRYTSLTILTFIKFLPSSHLSGHGRGNDNNDNDGKLTIIIIIIYVIVPSFVHVVKRPGLCVIHQFNSSIIPSENESRLGYSNRNGTPP